GRARRSAPRARGPRQAVGRADRDRDRLDLDCALQRVPRRAPADRRYAGDAPTERELGQSGGLVLRQAPSLSRDLSNHLRRRTAARWEAVGDAGLADAPLEGADLVADLFPGI